MAEQETIFDRWAKEQNITVEEMRAILSARIEQGISDPNPEKRTQWHHLVPEKSPRPRNGYGML